MSSLGHQKIMKSEDVKIGNIIISQLGVIWDVVKYERPTLNILEDIFGGGHFFFIK